MVALAIIARYEALRRQLAEIEKRLGVEGSLADEEANIISPRIVVTLGLEPVRAILKHFGMLELAKLRLRDLVAKGPYKLPETSTMLFPVFHCGAWGIYNRHLQLQKEDWTHIARYLRSLEMETRH